MTALRVLLAVLAAFSFLSCARVDVKPPLATEPPPDGDVRGVLVLEGLSSFDPGGVEISSESATVRTNSVGQFSFRDFPRGKSLLVAEKRAEGGSVRRIMGMSTIHFEDSPVIVRLRMRDATRIDSFCLDCHPPFGQQTRRDQIVRDIHPSGIAPVKALKGSELLDSEGKVTCESCHTLHRNVGFPKFTRNSFTDGKLCVNCH